MDFVCGFRKFGETSPWEVTWKLKLNINTESENGPLEGEITFGNHHFQVPCEFSWLQYFVTTCHGKHYMPGAWLFARFLKQQKRLSLKTKKRATKKTGSILLIDEIPTNSCAKLLHLTMVFYFYGFCCILLVIAALSIQQNPPHPTRPHRTPGPFGCTCVSWWASLLHFAAWRFEEGLPYSFDRKTIFKWWKTLKKPVKTINK